MLGDLLQQPPGIPPAPNGLESSPMISSSGGGGQPAPSAVSSPSAPSVVSLPSAPQTSSPPSKKRKAIIGQTSRPNPEIPFLERVMNNECLVNADIALAGSIISLQFPHMPRLKDPALNPILDKSEARRRGVLQIMDTGQLHWVLVYSDHTENVQVYDSLFSAKPLDNDIFVSMVCALKKYPGPSLAFCAERSQRQIDKALSGVFAIADAVSICFGKDPKHIQYKINKMSKHLIKCIQRHKFFMFPHHDRVASAPSKSNGSDGASDRREFKLICACRMPLKQSRVFSTPPHGRLGREIRCQACEAFFHELCVGFLPGSFVLGRSYKCDSCRSRSRQGK